MNEMKAISVYRTVHEGIGWESQMMHSYVTGRGGVPYIAFIACNDDEDHMILCSHLLMNILTDKLQMQTLMVRKQKKHYYKNNT